LFVNGRALPRQQDRDRASREILTEGQLTMNHLQTQQVLYNLALADGTYWEISAGDKEAAAIVSQLGEAMQLRVASDASESHHHGNRYRLIVRVDANSPQADWHVPLASKNNGAVVSILRTCAFWGGPYINLMRLSLIFARQAQVHGGVLLHGALAERDGMGVILAASGGTGKSTASNRLPAPWRPLCDDTTLVVRDAQGNYWAHPWPTWSLFLDGEPGGAWGVQNAVPLKGIFFLAQAGEDRVERIGSGHAASLLVECEEQVSTLMARGLSKEEFHAMYLERFNSLCSLAKVIRAHMLHISLTGAFWQEMDQALFGCRK
jgi:SynChlorMet cassette protein ScmC